MEQLSLNYQEIMPSDVASRSVLRELFTVSTRVAYKVPFENLKVREGFNKRIVYEEIEELALSIKENGLIEPLTVDIMADGTAWIEKGHRRLKALQFLVENGEMIDYVECYPNPKSVTEFDRMLHQYTSNNLNKKMKPIEAANIAFALKNNFGDISNEKIAEKMGVSRQTVDNLLLLASAPDVIKQQMIQQDMTAKDALALIANEKKLKKMADKVEENAAQSSMYKTIEPKDVNAQELKDSAALEKEIANTEEGWEESDEEVRMTNNVSGETKDDGKPLNLVGNSISENSKTAKEDDETVKYDMGRPEITFVQNCIKLADKLEAITNRFDIPEGSKKDVADIVKWMQKDLAELRTWVHSNKKQNKIR